MRRIIADKTRKDRRQSALSVSSAFYLRVLCREHHLLIPYTRLKTDLVWSSEFINIGESQAFLSDNSAKRNFIATGA
jgi:hypothetical protein